MADTGRKRKRPPTFQHYPANRAKKLKKEWVEKAKIKSQWKAQKRREGIVTKPAGFPSNKQEDHARDVDRAESEENDKSDDNSELGRSDSDSGFIDHKPRNENSRLSEENDDDDDEESTDNEEPTPQPQRPHSRKLKGPDQRSPFPSKQKPDKNHSTKRRLPHSENPTPTQDATSTGTSDDTPSIRELFQKAYSKSSLHTYKSDPLKKRRDQRHGSVPQRGGGRGGRGGAAASSSSTRGRGQPNMKLRMNAMLEKIKRDYS